MTTRPNVLWLMSDQHRFDALGCAGQPWLQTPALDALAARGVRMVRSYTTNPICCPSRASMHTGRYPREHHVWNCGISLPPSQTTLAQTLAGSGYTTGVVGKLHLEHSHQTLGLWDTPMPAESMHVSNGVEPEIVWDFWRNWHGPTYGFEEADLVLQHGGRTLGGGHYGQWLHDTHPDAIDRWAPENAAGQVSGDGLVRTWTTSLPEELHYDHWIADHAIDFLRRHQDGPFFLHASFPDPHYPLTPPQPYGELYRPEDMPEPIPATGLDQMPPTVRGYHDNSYRELPYIGRDGLTGAVVRQPYDDMAATGHTAEMAAKYYGLVTLVDAAIGRILAELDALGLAENTIVLFNADHGELMGDHGLMYKGPFHYESLVRIPTIWSWPGQLRTNETDETIMSGVDVMPTVLDLCGVDRPATVQGQSLADRLAGDDQVDDRGWALVDFRERELGFQAKTLVTSRHKVTVYPGHEFGELFDLEADPQELDNLWDEPGHSDVRAALTRQLLDTLCLTEDPTPQRLTPHS